MHELENSSTSSTNTNTSLKKKFSSLDESEQMMKESSMNKRCFFIFFFLGALNNLSYEVILCFSNDLAKEFNEEKFMSVFSGCLVLFGIFARFINSKFLLKIRHRTKNFIVIAFFVLGILTMFFAKYFNVFVFSLFGTLFFGIGTSLGDSNDLGFMKGLPSIVASGHSSGTGLSGMVGSSFYLLLKIFNFSFYAVIGSMLVFYPFYGFCFHLALRFKQEWNSVQVKAKENSLLEDEIENETNKEKEGLKKEEQDDANEFFDNDNTTHRESDKLELEMGAIEDQESQINQNLTWQNLKTVWPKSYSYIIAFFTLYLLEYIANSWITSQIIEEFSKKYDPNHQPFFIEYGFELALVVYRVVLFAGRSSLNLFKCRRIWVFILILFVCDIFYFFQSLVGTTFTIVTMYGTIILIAAFGGIIFCNIIYISLENKSLKKSEKEITLNLLTIFGDVGVLASSLIGLVVPKLVYK
jgi:hypothetical protein